MSPRGDSDVATGDAGPAVGAAAVGSAGVSDADLVERFSHVTVDRDTAAFYRGWLEHELRLNRCNDCGHWAQPPRPMCPSCWSTSVSAQPVTGRGTVHLLMHVHQGPAAPGVDYMAGPYPVVTVELEEQVGLRLTSTVIGCPSSEVTIGMPVELDWIDRYGAPFPVFRPAARASSGDPVAVATDGA